MLMEKGFHMVHYEALKMEEMGFHMTKEFSGKGSTQKLYMFPNGYGASVIKGFMSFGYPELAVLFFENRVKNLRSRKKRHKKKALKKAGQSHLTYDTPITSDVKRYDDLSELNKDLHAISKLKAYS